MKEQKKTIWWWTKNYNGNVIKLLLRCNLKVFERTWFDQSLNKVNLDEYFTQEIVLI